MGLVLPHDDVIGIAERVRHGDADIGWRGDETMDVIADEATGTVNVVGFDGQGGRYIAASESLNDPGWRFSLLRRLRDGDWQDESLVDKVVARMAKPQEDKDRAREELMDSLVEKTAWAIRRDAGHLAGVSTREFY